MKITFLIGNAFDQGAGFHTSYQDFYTDLLAEAHNGTPGEVLIRHSIRKDQEAAKKYWADFESGLGKFTKDFTPVRFKSNSEDCGLDWDFKTPTLAERIDYFYDGIKYAQKKLKDYLEEINSTEMQKAKLSASGCSAFRQWIATPFTWFDKDSKELDLLVQQYSNSQDEDWEICFLSFNYTSLLDNCIAQLYNDLSWFVTLPCAHTKSYRINNNVIHIHGSFKSDFVCGVGEDIQITNRSFRKPVHYQKLWKEKMIDTLRRTWYADASLRINESRIICIYGLSLGDTDIFWWRTIGSWLVANPNNQLVIFNYIGDADVNLGLTHIDCNRKAESFCKKSGIDYSKHKDRIHIVPFSKNKFVQKGWFQN